METSMVSLPLNEYLELRDFQKEILNGKRCSIKESVYRNGFTTIKRNYYTDNEIVLDFEKRIKELECEITRLENKNAELSSNSKKHHNSYWKSLIKNNKL